MSDDSDQGIAGGRVSMRSWASAWGIVTTAAAIVLAMSTVATASAEPLHEHATGTYRLNIFSNPIMVTGTGTLSLDGDETPNTPVATGNFSFSADCQRGSGTATLTETGASSDTLTQSITGFACTANATSSASYTITGGTGRFAGAMGTGTIATTVNTASGTFSATEDGTYVLPSHTLTVNHNGYGSGTVTSDPSGIDCGHNLTGTGHSSCSAGFAEGSPVELTATPESGSTFFGFSGDCTVDPDHAGQCTTTMDAAKTVTATFALAPATATTETFNFSGAADPEVWKVPPGVTKATFDVYGAEGGPGTFYRSGLGGHATVTLRVTPGHQYEIRVGGQGSNNTAGFNGGGAGESGGGGGGGATDIRTDGSELDDRTLVAGGGGGGAALCPAAGGGGGGLSGADGSNGCTSPGFGGSQTQGGAGGNPGTKGQGGNGDNYGGGGGGGWYGGGGPDCCSGGGGGSGHGPPETVFETGVRQGNGIASVTFDGYDLTIAPAGNGYGTVVSEPVGISCDSSDSSSACTAPYGTATPVTLTATASSFSTFTGFSGGDCIVDPDHANKCTTTVDAAKTVTATFVRTPTSAVNDSANVGEDSGANTIDVRLNDTDPDSNNDLIVNKTDGTHGTVKVTHHEADVSYTPDADFCGSDSFTYTLNSSPNGTATVTVTVNCADDPATAVNDDATLDEDSGANTIDVRQNDTDPDTANAGGTKDLITAKTDGANGSVAITNGNTDLTYTPNADFCGSDSFTYKLNDSASGTATVSVSVTCVDEPDGDNDGVTDATDNCPNDANPGQEDSDSDGLGDACDATDDRPGTVPGPNPEPETTIGHFPKNPKRDHTHFRFRSSIAGSTFTCQLDKEDPEPCKSPQDYRTLETGRHVFRVFATSPQGVSDPTPAKARFRISG